LSEPSPVSLDDLFSREPETLTDTELELIVQALRKHYQQFVLDETKARASGEKRVKTAKTKEQVSINLQDVLDSLDL
jgi:DNA/RNA-binding domain of Phe-tRNA-synthetase-like protein